MKYTCHDEFLASVRQQYPQDSITMAQFALITGRKVSTIHDWSSRGRLDGFKTGKGRGTRLLRDPATRWHMSN